MVEKKVKKSQDDMAKERTELSEIRTGMAVERTDLAYERTALANSQTLLAYFRTAIATFAAGIGMFEFVSNKGIMDIGIGLMAVSPVIAIVGIIHYTKVRRKINKIMAADLIAKKQEVCDD